MFVTWILNKRAGVLNKEQINLSERTRYDIFLVSCELPMAVGVEDRKESGPWKYYKGVYFYTYISRAFENLSKV